MHAQYQVHAPFWRVAPMLAAARYSAPATLQLPSSAVTRAVPYHAVCAEWQSYIAFVRPTAGRAVHPVSQQSASHLSTQSASQPATFPPRRPVSHSPMSQSASRPSEQPATPTSQPPAVRAAIHSFSQPLVRQSTHSPPQIRLRRFVCPALQSIRSGQSIDRYADTQTQRHRYGTNDGMYASLW